MQIKANWNTKIADVSPNSQVTGDATTNEASQPSTAFLSTDDGAVGVGAQNNVTGHGNLSDSSASGTNVGNTSGATSASGVASGLSATSFQIDVTYDSSVTTSSMATEIETAVNYVVNLFEGLFTNPITINIDVGWGEVAGTALGSGALGESSTNYDTYAYSNVLTALNSTANASGDAAQLAAYSTLPQTNPTSGNIAVSSAEAKALGLSSGTGLDGAVGFSSSATWSFSPTAAPATGAYYFIGVVEHEISEVMGRLSFVGSSADTVMDLFRYSAPNTRDLSSSHGGTNTTAYFSIDSGTTNLGSWNNVSRNGDLGDWYPSGPAPGGNDAFNDINNSGVINALSTNDLTLLNVLGYDTSCFMAGTLIRTPNCDIAVETLKRGDLVVTSDGQAKPVSWLGRQTISTMFADPLRVYPIRIRAGALGENVPARDLLLSPDHAILIGKVLIQAGALVNGVSIVREAKIPKIFTYYHVELDDHSLILAENTPAETFIDNVDRMAFDNWAEHEAGYPDGKPMVDLPYPRAKAHRQIPSAIRARLSERAKTFKPGIVANAAA